MKTVSLETAKQLKEAGFPQESHFKWVEGSNGKGKYFIECDERVITSHAGWDTVAAPTAEEILERLPTLIKSDQIDGRDREYHLEINKIDSGYDLRYIDRWTDLDTDKMARTIPNGGYFANASFAEAAAKLYLYLKKEALTP